VVRTAGLPDEKQGSTAALMTGVFKEKTLWFFEVERIAPPAKRQKDAGPLTARTAPQAPAPSLRPLTPSTGGPILTREDPSAGLKERDAANLKESQAAQQKWDSDLKVRAAQQDAERQVSQLARDVKTRAWCASKGPAAEGYCECGKFVAPLPVAPGGPARGCTK
jgi:hypothetical protein